MKYLYICPKSDKALKNAYLNYCISDFSVAVLNKKTTDELIIKKEEHGKPYIVGGKPEFSISHSEDVWSCAVSLCRVGLDIQIMKESANMCKVAKRFFTNEEYELVKSGAELGCEAEIFYNIWVRKEAFIKLTGNGLSQGLATFAVADKKGIFSSVNNEGKYIFTDVSECFSACDEYRGLVKGMICSEADEDVIVRTVNIC